ncbi:hypothetical protein JCM1841_003795 [Sporobolomyces salmonicolor]
MPTSVTFQGQRQQTHDTRSTLNVVHDTLGGGAPLPLPHGGTSPPPVDRSDSSEDSDDDGDVEHVIDATSGMSPPRP